MTRKLPGVKFNAPPSLAAPVIAGEQLTLRLIPALTTARTGDVANRH
jgi:hypothetical protein